MLNPDDKFMKRSLKNQFHLLLNSCLRLTNLPNGALSAFHVDNSKEISAVPNSQVSANTLIESEDATIRNPTHLKIKQINRRVVSLSPGVKIFNYALVLLPFASHFFQEHPQS